MKKKKMNIKIQTLIFEKVKYLKESDQLLCSFCNVKGALDHLINYIQYKIFSSCGCIYIRLHVFLFSK